MSVLCGLGLDELGIARSLLGEDAPRSCARRKRARKGRSPAVVPHATALDDVIDP